MVHIRFSTNSELTLASCTGTCDANAIGSEARMISYKSVPSGRSGGGPSDPKLQSFTVDQCRGGPRPGLLGKSASHRWRRQDSSPPNNPHRAESVASAPPCAAAWHMEGSSALSPVKLQSVMQTSLEPIACAWVYEPTCQYHLSSLCECVATHAPASH